MNKIVLFISGLVVGLIVSGIVFLAINKEHVINDEIPEIAEVVNSDTVYIKEKRSSSGKQTTDFDRIPTVDTLDFEPINEEKIDSEEYVVLRDKLLHSQRVKIVTNLYNTTSNASDKLTERMSSDDFFSDHIQVEFWDSPIDYQGYRLNKTKLILFGINPNESFMLMLNAPGVITMQTGEFKVMLQPTEKYRSFNFQ